VTGAQFGQPGYSPQDAEQARAAADPSAPGYQAAAAQAVGSVVQPDQGTDAGESVQQMQDAAVRAAMSDYEQKLKDMMAAADKQSQQFAQQFDLMQRQLATVQAQAGPPIAELLARSLATRVASIARTHPDLGAQHFSGVMSQAESLADEVHEVSGSGGDTARAEQLANGIGTWFTRVHPRMSAKFLEGAGAALDEAERILEELPKLAPVAAAVMKAV
jgi:hypothetical protein